MQDQKMAIKVSRYWSNRFLNVFTTVKISFKAGNTPEHEPKPKYAELAQFGSARNAKMYRQA